MDELILAEDAARLSTFSPDDVKAGLDILVERGRQEGESAYSAIDVITEAIRGVQRGRRISDAAAHRKAQEQQAEQHRKAHPEEYFRIEELVKPLLAKFGASRTEAK